jgi:hypothetical protein
LKRREEAALWNHLEPSLEPSWNRLEPSLVGKH